MNNKTNSAIVVGLFASLAIVGGLFAHEFVNNQMETPPGYRYHGGTMSNPSNPLGGCFAVEFSYPVELATAESEAYAFDPANSAHVRVMNRTTCGNSRG